MKRQLTTLALALGLCHSGAAQAILIDRGGGLIYDNVLNITWLQDANYAKTSGYDDDGRMMWGGAWGWAYDLSYYDSVRKVTYDDWRLPTMIDTRNPGCDEWWEGSDCGYNVQTYDAATGTVFSELAYMYHVNLGLLSALTTSGHPDYNFGIFGNGTYNGTDLYSYGQNDVGLIGNLQAYAYWTAQEYRPNHNTHEAWFFAPMHGQQGYVGESFEYFAWAVRDGDVAAPSGVPEPGTAGLLALGLLGLGLSRRRG